MSINIDELSEEELADLNHRVVERIRFLRQAKAHYAMMEFKVGERVTFEPHDRPPVFGTLTRYNKKTVTVKTDCGHSWNVPPYLLKRASENGLKRVNSFLELFPTASIESSK